MTTHDLPPSSYFENDEDAPQGWETMEEYLEYLHDNAEEDKFERSKGN